MRVKSSMRNAFKYPNTLCAQVRSAWRVKRFSGENITPLPPAHILTTLLEVAYHASLMREETRTIQFGLVYCRPKEFAKAYARFQAHGNPLFAIELIEPRHFSADELLRLAPATDPTRVLIAVQAAILRRRS